MRSSRPKPMEMVVAPDGRYAKIVKVGALCVSCRPENQQLVLNALLARNTGQPLPNGLVATWASVHDWCVENGMSVSARAIRDHAKHHVEFSDKPTYATGAGSRTEVLSPGEEEERRVAAFRQRVSERLEETGAGQVDARGGHTAYLERIVEIAAVRAEEFPEQVTLEMGLRAAAELTKAKTSGERDELLRMLAAASQRTAGSVGTIGVRRVKRQVIDAVPEEVRVAEDDPSPRSLPSALVAD